MLLDCRDEYYALVNDCKALAGKIRLCVDEHVQLQVPRLHTALSTALHLVENEDFERALKVVKRAATVGIFDEDVETQSALLRSILHDAKKLLRATDSRDLGPGPLSPSRAYFFFRKYRVELQLILQDLDGRRPRHPHIAELDELRTLLDDPATLRGAADLRRAMTLGAPLVEQNKLAVKITPAVHNAMWLMHAVRRAL